MEFSNWKELETLLDKGSFEGRIFRGVKDYTFPLNSKLERIFEKYNIPKDNWLRLEKESIELYKKLSSHKNIPQNDLLGWISHMQHYGAPTRLTDWSFSPFVACYFAYEDIIGGSNSAALWMLNYSLIKSIYGINKNNQGEILNPHDPNFIPDNKNFNYNETFQNGVLISRIKTSKHSTPFQYEKKTAIDDENYLLKMTIENEVELPLPISNYDPDERMIKQHACFVSMGVLGINPSPIEQLMLQRPIESLKLDKINLNGRYFFCNNTRLVPNEGVATNESNKHIHTKYEVKHILQLPEELICKIKLPYSWREEVLKTLEDRNITATALFPNSFDAIGKQVETFISKGTFKE